MSNEEKNCWFMNIPDKIYSGNGDICPPHRLPHTLPIVGEMVRDESCHVHECRLRVAP